MTRPAAVVFDMDGILIETEPIWDTVRRRLAAADGLTYPDSSTPIMMGLSTQEWAEHLESIGGRSRPCRPRLQLSFGIVGDPLRNSVRSTVCQTSCGTIRFQRLIIALKPSMSRRS